MEFLCKWWDVVAFGVVGIIHVASWLEARHLLSRDPKNSLPEREFAASSLNSASVAGVTAVSILIPASLLIVQVGYEKPDFPHSALEDVFRASLWFLVSLALGLLLLFLVPMRSQKHNAARDVYIGILFGPQLAALLTGMIWFVAGIHSAVYK
jgi:hypothetical protein